MLMTPHAVAISRNPHLEVATHPPERRLLPLVPEEVIPPGGQIPFCYVIETGMAPPKKKKITTQVIPPADLPEELIEIYCNLDQKQRNFLDILAPEDRNQQLIYEKNSAPNKDVPYQLPLWPELARAMPNHIARSQLFAPIKRGSRKSYFKEQLASREDVVICYTGKQLDMADQDVFLQALQLFRGRSVLERSVVVNRAEFLKSIGKSTGKSDYVWLDDSMHRLKTGTLSCQTKKKKIEMSLVTEWARDDETGEIRIEMSPNLRAFFESNEYGYVNWPHRMAIEKKVDLAKWLQTYFSAHGKGAQKHRIETIKHLCGSATRINDFVDDVEEALEELVRVKEIANLRITDRTVTFTRKGE